jgi:hypothetical protein
MSKNTKKPRRPYDPKRLERTLVDNAVTRALKARKDAEYRAGMMNLSDDALCDLGIAYHMAFELMRKHGGEDLPHARGRNQHRRPFLRNGYRYRTLEGY